MDNYSFYCYIRDLPEVLGEATAIETQLRLNGNITGAERVATAVRTMEAELLAMAVEVAAAGTDILRQKERDSRVGRGDTEGAGGARLEDYLQCDPIPEYGGVGWGSIGICNETLLDRHVEWWWTNETGYGGHVGRIIYGVFMPGESYPERSEFREHPLFEPRGRGERRRSGVIQNPIPARRFVENSLPEIESLWRTEADAIKAAFRGEMLAAMAP